MTNRKYVRLRERGRRLASLREDLIAAGANPAELHVPLYPVEPLPRRAGRHALPPDPYDDAPVLESDLARVWLLVTVACVAAFAGSVAGGGAMLIITEEPTWHVWVAAIAGIGWAGAAVSSARTASRLYRQARGAAQP